jgi:hypothetical protein
VVVSTDIILIYHTNQHACLRPTHESGSFQTTVQDRDVKRLSELTFAHLFTQCLFSTSRSRSKVTRKAACSPRPRTAHQWDKKWHAEREQRCAQFAGGGCSGPPLASGSLSSSPGGHLPALAVPAVPQHDLRSLETPQAFAFGSALPTPYSTFACTLQM